MHLFRWRVKTPMIVTATLAVVMAIPIEMRKRSMRRFVAFHAAGARDLREAMRVSEMASIECGRLAAPERPIGDQPVAPQRQSSPDADASGMVPLVPGLPQECGPVPHDGRSA